jgi:thiamine biosynthesis lipoprotein
LPEARAALDRELALVDAACSRFRHDSELVRVNAAAGRQIAISAYLTEALRAALRAAALTAGLVDPTVGSSLRLAGYDATFALVRGRDGATFRPRFEPAVGWESIELDGQHRTVRTPARVELDLGATAKALAADRIARSAGRASGTGVLVSLGGDVAVDGPVPDGGWPIRVADDHAADPDEPGPAVALSSGGLATSGTTVRRWLAGEVSLHHLVDPRTGRPAETPWRTVTVAGSSCVDANIASTAAVILGEDAPAWLASRGLPARLVREAGEVTYVGGWPEDDA